MKKPLFFLLFITSLSFYGQTEKWHCFLQKNQEGKYYLVKNGVAEKLSGEYTTIRILDREHSIVRMNRNPDIAKRKYGQDKILPVNDLWKISPGVDLSAKGKTAYIIKTLDKNCLEDTIRKHGLHSTPLYNGYLMIKTSGLYIHDHILPLDCVTYIGEESLVPVREGTIPDQNLAVNRISLLHEKVPELLGENMILSVKDDLYNIDDIDISGKHIASGNQAKDVSRHATDMATIATGLGNTSINGKGAAPESRLSSSDFRSLYPDTDLQSLDIVTQNHSYGTQIENFYGSLAEAYDAYLYDNPLQVHLFSSGNSGSETSSDGVYSGIPGFANITGNFKMAKNILTVGALDTQLSVPSFSSKGPAYDGRIKPDLTAFSSIGTSNANALVSGITLLLQQYYRKEHQDSLPPSSLIKAILINGADDIDTPGPDFHTGYGNANAYESWEILKNKQFISGSVGYAQAREYTIPVPEDAGTLKVTLSWTDLPAEPNSNIALVNDLDLTVIHGSKTVDPWILDHNANEEALNKPAVRGKDHINNTEQVFVENITENTVTIRVQGHAITGDNQNFSIAYSWIKTNDFEWVNPVAGNSFPYDGISTDFLRWRNTFPITNGKLDVSYDSGSTWNTIHNEVALSPGYFSWDPVTEEGKTATLRMTIGSESFISPPFLISYALRPRISLKCGDIIEISWTKNTAAIAYDIFSLQNNTMTFTEQVTDTTYIISGDSRYHAVAPVYTNNVTGIRSETVSIITDREQCYWESIYATNLEDENRILLYFSLGSTYRAQRIEIYKITYGEEELIQQINPINQKEFRVWDNNPVEGGNMYRAKLILEDGTEIYSETVNAIYLATTPFLVFPNPVTSDGINVYSKSIEEDKEVYIYLYSVEGKFIFRKQVISDRDFISLARLTNGIYYYSIEVAGKKRKSGGLILNRI
ncbi:S8 family serine peptidase [Sinomicrobium sp. M5D2P9]